MNPDTIQTESAYRAALAEIERLMDGHPEPGTADSERLDRLVDQVVEYEAIHYPMGEPSAEAMAEYEAEKRGRTHVDDNFGEARTVLESNGVICAIIARLLRDLRDNVQLGRAHPTG